MTWPPPDLAARLARMRDDHALPRLAAAARAPRDGFPHITEAGRWRTTPAGGWTGGFWAGQLWLAWRATADPVLRAAAEAWTARLLPRITTKQADFDLGFLIRWSAALGADLTGRDDLARAALAAAERLAGMIHPAAGVLWCIHPERRRRLGNGFATVNADTLATVDLLWWAAKRFARPDLAAAARRHSLRTWGWLARPCGWCAHLADFDRGSGRFLRLDTRQGVAPLSVWSRAQAWAAFGLETLHQQTGQPAAGAARAGLVTAWLQGLPPDGVPPWDFTPGAAGMAADSSAAAILLAALARAGRARPLSAPETALADRLVDGLMACRTAPDADGLIDRASYFVPRRDGLRCASVWGDMFLTTALVDPAGPAA